MESNPTTALPALPRAGRLAGPSRPTLEQYHAIAFATAVHAATTVA